MTADEFRKTCPTCGGTRKVTTYGATDWTGGRTDDCPDCKWAEPPFERPYGAQDPVVLHTEGEGGLALCCGLPVRMPFYPEMLPARVKERCAACAQLSKRESLRVLDGRPLRSQQPRGTE